MAAPPEDQVAELRLIHNDISWAEEAGHTYILLRSLNLPEGCTPKECEALLCPDGQHGYEARLFFAVKVATPAPRNWNLQVNLFGRNWFAFSWQLKATNLRLAQMLSMFLEALR